MPNDDIDDSRIIEDAYVSFEITSVTEDTLVDSSTLILEEVHVSCGGSIDVVNVLVESSTLISDDIYIHEDNTSDSEHVLVESSMLVQVIRYSLATPMIETGFSIRSLLLALLHLLSH